MPGFTPPTIETLSSITSPSRQPSRASTAALKPRGSGMTSWPLLQISTRSVINRKITTLGSSGTPDRTFECDIIDDDRPPDQRHIGEREPAAAFDLDDLAAIALRHETDGPVIAKRAGLHGPEHSATRCRSPAADGATEGSEACRPVERRRIAPRPGSARCPGHSCPRVHWATRTQRACGPRKEMFAWKESCCLSTSRRRGKRCVNPWSAISASSLASAAPRQ